MASISKKNIRQRIHKRIRKKISGSEECPRLSVTFSNTNVYAQIIDDHNGKTLASANSLQKGMPKDKPMLEKAEAVGKAIAEKAKDSKVKSVVFDRGGFKYHGKVAKLAETARAGGLEF